MSGTDTVGEPVVSDAPVTPLEPHAEWRADDVSEPADWTLELTGAELAELDAALAHARTVTDDVLDVSADDFPLPTLAARLHDFAAELVDGRGFGRIGTLDIERLGAEDAVVDLLGHRSAPRRAVAAEREGPPAR